MTLANMSPYSFMYGRMVQSVSGQGTQVCQIGEEGEISIQYLLEKISELYDYANDIVEGEFYTLEEWRKEDKYRNCIDS